MIEVKALALIGVEVVATVAVVYAATFGYVQGAANAAPLRTCQYEDGTVGTDCLWSAEVDGQERLLPQCVNEDGNVDGQPCIWFSPRTGSSYYVTSEEYR